MGAVTGAGRDRERRRMFRANMKNMALLPRHMAKRGFASREPRGPIIEQATRIS